MNEELRAYDGDGQHVLTLLPAAAPIDVPKPRRWESDRVNGPCRVAYVQRYVRGEAVGPPFPLATESKLEGGEIYNVTTPAHVMREPTLTDEEANAALDAIDSPHDLGHMVRDHYDDGTAMPIFVHLDYGEYDLRTLRAIVAVLERVKPQTEEQTPQPA